MERGAVLTNSLFSLCSICWTVVICHLCFTVFVRMLPSDYLPLQCIALLILSCWSLSPVWHFVVSWTVACQSTHPWNFYYFFILNYETEVCLLPSRTSFEIVMRKDLFLWELTWFCIKWMFSWLYLSNLGTLKLIWILCDSSFLFKKNSNYLKVFR